MMHHYKRTHILKGDRYIGIAGKAYSKHNVYLSKDGKSFKYLERRNDFANDIGRTCRERLFGQYGRLASWFITDLEELLKKDDPSVSPNSR